MYDERVIIVILKAFYICCLFQHICLTLCNLNKLVTGHISHSSKQKYLEH